jgi:protein involved in polysaccharide export with SLBB domain
MSKGFSMLFRPFDSLAVALLAMLCGAQDQRPNLFGESYLIRPGDELRITVAAEPDLSGWVSVRTDGSITMPLLRSVPAAGLTTRKLQETLVEKLMHFIKVPQVQVDVSDKAIPPARPRKWLSPPERPTPFPLSEPRY